MDLLLDAIYVQGRPDLINKRYPAFACCQEPARALARTSSASKGLVYMGGRDRRKRRTEAFPSRAPWTCECIQG